MKKIIKLEDENLTHQITLRFSDKEWSKIEKAFEVSGYPYMATFLRVQLLTWFEFVRKHNIQVVSLVGIRNQKENDNDN